MNKADYALEHDLLSVGYDLDVAGNRVIEAATDFIRGRGKRSLLEEAVTDREKLIVRLGKLRRKKQQLLDSILVLLDKKIGGS